MCSPTKNGTRAPSIGGTVLTPWASREVPPTIKKKESNVKIKGSTGRATWPAALLKGRTLRSGGGVHEGRGAAGTRGVTAPAPHQGPGQPESHGPSPCSQRLVSLVP